MSTQLRSLARTCAIVMLALFSAHATAQLRFADRLHNQTQSSSMAARKEAILQSIANGTFKVANGPRLKNHGPAPDPAGLVLPHWNSSFRTGGVDYPFTVIGGDPAAGQTTVIPVVIVPYRFQFADGSAIDGTTDVIDGDTPLDRTLTSPLFNDYPFMSGATPLGPTQWGDAYMRGNFWSLHGGQNSGYHVRLQIASVAPVQVIDIRPDAGFTISYGSETIGFVDFTYLGELIAQRIVALGIPPSMLSIHLTSELIGISPVGPIFSGFHHAVDLGSITGMSGVNTYIETGTFPDQSSVLNVGDGDGAVLAHEIVEWLMDPLVVNKVPVWQEPLIPQLCDNSNMEVADPLEFLPGAPITFNNRSYRFPDVAFLPWFGRIATPYSVNGWYSMGNSLPSYSQKCPFFEAYAYYYFPNDTGMNAAYLTSLNTHHQATLYAFYGSTLVSYLLSNVDPLNPNAPPITVSPLAVPGAVGGTYPLHINEQSQVVGVWFDAQAREHGFLLTNGQYTTIDVPGAVATEVLGINSSNLPTLVGDYLDINGVVHGFTLQDGNVRTVDVPNAAGTAVKGINDMNKIVGTYRTPWGTARGFAGNPGRTDTLDYPAPGYGETMPSSINDAGHIAGTYLTDGSFVSPAHVQNAFVFGAGNFTPVDSGIVWDSLPTTLNDINNDGLMAGSFVLPGSGPTATFAVPYSLFLPIVYSSAGSSAAPPSGAIAMPLPWSAPTPAPAGH